MLYTGAVEKQKLVYILNRDAQARLTISSPLEAHKSNTLVYHMIGVDVGFENPTFACLEIDYEVGNLFVVVFFNQLTIIWIIVIQTAALKALSRFDWSDIVEKANSGLNVSEDCAGHQSLAIAVTYKISDSNSYRLCITNAYK